MSTGSQEIARQRVEVEVLGDWSQVAALAPLWNGLLSRCRQPSIFLSWEWIEAWWQVYGAGFELAFLVARAGDAVVGIAPLVVRRDRRRLEFVGQNRAFGEYLDFIVAEGDEEAVSPALCRALVESGVQSRWDSLCFTTVLETSPNVRVVEEILAGAGFPLRRSAARVCRFAELPATWEAFLARKSGRWRARLRYIETRLERRGSVALEVARDPAEVGPFFSEFVELHEARWGSSMDPAFLAFLRRLAPSLFRRGELLLARLRVGSTVTAAKYDFVHGGKIWGYQGGWLPELAGYEVGSALLAEIFEWGIGQGLREYDFLEGDAWYKRRWSTAQRTAVDLVFGGEPAGYVFEARAAGEGSG